MCLSVTRVVHLYCVATSIVDVVTSIKLVYFVFQLNESNVFDVLRVGDMYLLQGLKRYCGNVISKYIDHDSVVSILRTARLLNLPRLEDDCAVFIAHNLEAVRNL